MLFSFHNNPLFFFFFHLEFTLHLIIHSLCFYTLRKEQGVLIPLAYTIKIPFVISQVSPYVSYMMEVKNLEYKIHLFYSPKVKRTIHPSCWHNKHGLAYQSITNICNIPSEGCYNPDVDKNQVLVHAEPQMRRVSTCAEVCSTEI